MTLDIQVPASGEVERDFLDVTVLPTGASEQLPYIVANGEKDGPTLWVTGSIHGNEVTGMAVCQDIIHDSLTACLSGRLVVLPNLNPSGLRRNNRHSYYDDDDPNRKFPDVEYVNSDASPEETVSGPRPPNQQEIICRRIFDAFADDADYLLDMHTASSGAYPFVIKDRVLYGRGLRDKEDARALADELDALAETFGLPVVFEYPVEEYIDQGFQCSTAGAALNQAGVPALTIELGQHNVVEQEWYQQGIAGTYRVMEDVGMVEDAEIAASEVLDSFPDPPEAPMDGQTRRYVGPHVPPEKAGIIRHEVTAGDVVEEGSVVARIVTPHGTEKAIIESEHDGWIIQRRAGIAGYEHSAVASMAVADDGGDRIGTPPDDEGLK